MIGVANELHALIAGRMADAATPAYRWPLGYPTWGTEEVLAALDCLCEQKTTMWDKCAAFEDQFSAYLGVTDSVMVNSGSSADLVLMLAARECGMLQPGDEVLIPAVTWPTQAWAAIQAGFSVRLVDVDPGTLNTSPEILEAAIGPKTKAIFLVHLMGNPCDMDGIGELAMEHSLLLFEDCCEALGASFDDRKVGSFGVASAFSFFASHHISTMEGGMISTSDSGFADACRLLRAHGWARDVKHRCVARELLGRYGYNDDPRYFFIGMGFNFRPTELQGAIGSIQLKKLDSLNHQRNKNAAHVQINFRSTNGHTVEWLMETSYKAKPAWFALPFVLQDGLPYTRKQISAWLEGYGVDTRPIVGGNLARHPAFAKYRNMVRGPLPGADAIHDRGFYVGLPPTDCDMNFIVGLLNGMDCYLRSAA